MERNPMSPLSGGMRWVFSATHVCHSHTHSSCILFFSGSNTNDTQAKFHLCVSMSGWHMDPVAWTSAADLERGMPEGKGGEKAKQSRTRSLPKTKSRSCISGAMLHWAFLLHVDKKHIYSTPVHVMKQPNVPWIVLQ